MMMDEFLSRAEKHIRVEEAILDQVEWKASQLESFSY